MTSRLSSSLNALVDETVLLFHRLRAAAEAIHGEGEPSAARRGVLRSLDRGGPQTVPQLAGARPVSRQHIQTIVDALAADHLVETLENPAHKRSVLIRLTPRGRARVRAIARLEADLLDRLDLGVTTGDIRTAVRVLQAFRSSLERGES
jgi:DNA-binding MarR family transcriptional regulator